MVNFSVTVWIPEGDYSISRVQKPKDFPISMDLLQLRLGKKTKVQLVLPRKGKLTSILGAKDKGRAAISCDGGDGMSRKLLDHRIAIFTLQPNRVFTVYIHSEDLARIFAWAMAMEQ